MSPVRTHRRSWFLASLLALLGGAGCGGGSIAAPGSAADGGASSGDDGGTANVGYDLTLLASLDNSSYSFAIDSTSAYALVTDNGNNDSTTVVKVPLSGGAPVTLATDAQYSEAIAVFGSTVYWVDPTGPDIPDASTSSDGLVMSTPLGGGSTATVASGQGFPENIAVDATGIYWVNASAGVQCTLPPCAAVVGQVVVLRPGAPTPVVLANIPAAPSSLALDATNVYWGTSDGRLMMVPKNAMGGATPTTLAYYEASVQSLVVSGSTLYWTTGTGDIMQTPVAGGASTAILVGTDSVSGLALDATSLYWITYGENETGTASLSTVNKMPLAGGTTSTLWSGTDSPDALQVDGASAVYFTTDSGSLWKLTPR